MTGIQCAEQAKLNGVQAIRPRKNAEGYDCKPYFTGSKKGWFILDSYSGSAIVAIHEALSPENKAKFEALSLVRMADISFKLINKR